MDAFDSLKPTSPALTPADDGVVVGTWLNATPRPAEPPPAWLTRCTAALARARETLERHNAARGGAKDSALSKASVVTYRKKASRLIASIKIADVAQVRGALVTSLSPYAPSSNHFHAMMAALRWALRKNLTKDAQLLAGDEQPPSQWPHLCERVEFAVEVLQMVDSVSRREVLEASGQRPRRCRSKRHDLRHLPADWRERMVAASASSPTYGAAVELLAVCGPRPAELQEGVYLYVDGDHVKVLVPGVKVTDSYGQPWRELRVRRDAFGPVVNTGLDEFGFVWIQVNGNSLRDYLRRLSMRLWPNLRAGRGPNARPLRVSAYSFRHALAEELREASWDDEQISMAMGHCAVETQRQYGRRRRRGGKTPRASAIASVQTARPVRQGRPDRLAALLASKQRSDRKPRP
jgi:integrase